MPLQRSLPITRLQLAALSGGSLFRRRHQFPNPLGLATPVSFCGGPSFRTVRGMVAHITIKEETNKPLPDSGDELLHVYKYSGAAGVADVNLILENLRQSNPKQKPIPVFWEPVEQPKPSPEQLAAAPETRSKRVVYVGHWVPHGAEFKDFSYRGKDRSAVVSFRFDRFDEKFAAIIAAACRKSAAAIGDMDWTGMTSTCARAATAEKRIASPATKKKKDNVAPSSYKRIRPGDLKPAPHSAGIAHGGHENRRKSQRICSVNAAAASDQTMKEKSIPLPKFRRISSSEELAEPASNNGPQVRPAAAASGTHPGIPPTGGPARKRPSRMSCARKRAPSPRKSSSVVRSSRSTLVVSSVKEPPAAASSEESSNISVAQPIIFETRESAVINSTLDDDDAGTSVEPPSRKRARSTRKPPPSASASVGTSPQETSSVARQEVIDLTLSDDDRDGDDVGRQNDRSCHDALRKPLVRAARKSIRPKNAIHNRPEQQQDHPDRPGILSLSDVSRTTGTNGSAASPPDERKPAARGTASTEGTAPLQSERSRPNHLVFFRIVIHGMTDSIGQSVGIPSGSVITLPSLRHAVNSQLVPHRFSSDLEWRFFIPSLGPIYPPQEELGWDVTQLLESGNGTVSHPFEVTIMLIEK